VDDPIHGHKDKPAPPVEVDREEEFQISNVEDSRVFQSQVQYWVPWTRDDSLIWEPGKYVDGLQAVREFHHRYPKKAVAVKVCSQKTSNVGGEYCHVLRC
jgi:hypothetical protein